MLSKVCLIQCVNGLFFTCLYEWPNTSPLQAIKTLSMLLGVKETLLEAMLTERVITTRTETFTRKLNVPDAELTRDAIVKSLYEVP